MRKTSLQEVDPRIVKDLRIAARGAAAPEKRGPRQSGFRRAVLSVRRLALVTPASLGQARWAGGALSESGSDTALVEAWAAFRSPRGLMEPTNAA